VLVFETKHQSTTYLVFKVPLGRKTPSPVKLCSIVASVAADSTSSTNITTINATNTATTAENAGAARQFVDLVTGPRGRETLAAAGFAAP